MKIFKSKSEKEAEAQEELSILLRSERIRHTILELLIDTKLQDQLNPIVENVRRRLVDYIDAEMIQVRNHLPYELTLLRQRLKGDREEITENAAEVRRALGKNLDEYEQEIVERTKLSMAGVIHDTLSSDLHNLLRREVRSFIRKRPLSSDLSNREIAAANRISLREVKRRRRRGCL